MKALLLAGHKRANVIFVSAQFRVSLYEQHMGSLCQLISGVSALVVLFVVSDLAYSNMLVSLFHLNHLDFLNDVIIHHFFFSKHSRENDSNDKSVKSKGFSENKDEDHTNVDVFLGVGTDTGVTDDTDSESSSESGETTTESSSEMLVAGVVEVLGVSDNGGGDN